MTLQLRNFYETGNRVNSDPLLCVFEDFLSDTEIRHLLAAAEPKLKRALISSERSAASSVGRSGSSCWVPHTYDGVIEDLSLRIAEVVGNGLEYAESLQVVHYAEGEEYAPHYDAWDKATERGLRSMARGGQRMVTCVLYLNDVDEGGGTSFPNLDTEVRAKKGRLLLIHNCHQGSTVRHPDSLHGSLPVRKGKKWACNLWFREMEYQPPDTAPTRSSEVAGPPKYTRVI